MTPSDTPVVSQPETPKRLSWSKDYPSPVKRFPTGTRCLTSPDSDVQTLSHGRRSITGAHRTTGGKNNHHLHQRNPDCELSELRQFQVPWTVTGRVDDENGRGDGDGDGGGAQVDRGTRGNLSSTGPWGQSTDSCPWCRCQRQGSQGSQIEPYVIHQLRPSSFILLPVSLNRPRPLKEVSRFL